MATMQRNVLLLTATITPLAGIPALARTDPKLRLQDYQKALVFYSPLIGTCFDAIVFAENSGSDLSALASSIKDPGAHAVEFISFYGLDFPPSHGRGYGEFRLVDFAIEHSKIIGENDIIWKVTGRYIIENIHKIVRSRPNGADLYCHMRNHPYRLCELYLLSWNSRAYNRVIKGIYPKLRSDIVPGKFSIDETLFRKEIDQAADRISVVPRFRDIPVISGVRGHDNRDYSKRWSMKNLARKVSHRLLPSLWI
jgi:hypothetical protein